MHEISCNQCGRKLDETIEALAEASEPAPCPHCGSTDRRIDATVSPDTVRVGVSQTISPTGIPSGEAFGTATIRQSAPAAQQSASIGSALPADLKADLAKLESAGYSIHLDNLSSGGIVARVYKGDSVLDARVAVTAAEADDALANAAIVVSEDLKRQSGQ